jgi:hypothetical protein
MQGTSQGRLNAVDGGTSRQTQEQLNFKPCYLCCIETKTRHCMLCAWTHARISACLPDWLVGRTLFGVFPMFVPSLSW